MAQRSNGWATSPRSVGTLIAVLVRYPEVSSLDFVPGDGLLTLSFCLRTELTPATFQALRDRLHEALETYRALIRAPEPIHCEFSQDSMQSVAILTLTRDIETLTVEEVGMVIEILRDEFGQDLVADPNELAEDEMLAQEETIQATLESLQESPGARLFALRDEGRVFVFNT
jgi:hypothetical protein